MMDGSSAQDVQETCGKQVSHGALNIEVGAGSFFLQHKSGETVHIRNLGTPTVEIVNQVPSEPTLALALDGGRGVMSYGIRAISEDPIDVGASVALFSHEPLAKTLDSQKSNMACPIPPKKGGAEQVFIEGYLRRAQPSLACEPLANPSHLAGHIAYVDRGECTFVQKILNAQAAGALGVIVGNVNAPRGEEEAHFMMGGDGTDRIVGVPAVMISKRSATRLLAKLQKAADDGTEMDVQMTRTVHSAIAEESTSTMVTTGREAGASPGQIVEQTLKAKDGKVDSFHYHTLGAWDVHVQESNNVFLLSVQAV
mmetsp:Transcript_18157/g.34613  ORF Transcript_18157/g.34613 Transcript_18157/m.34613 type:complete len:311 (-) Transcript_18157:242-1174(-)